MDPSKLRELRFHVVMPEIRKIVLREHGHIRLVTRLKNSHYPSGPAYSDDEHDSYSYDEAVEVLRIFNRRWIESGVVPEERVQPYAEETVHPRVWKRPARFTLYQVEPWPVRELSLSAFLEVREELFGLHDDDDEEIVLVA